MAQYTRCVEFDDFKNHWQGSSQNPAAPLFFNALSKAFVYMIVGALGGAALGVLGGGVGAIAGAALGAYIGFSYGFVEGFCDQWLNWRLICVKRNQCGIGRVAWIETVAAKFAHDPIEWLFDNDLSFNLRLVPYNGKVQVGGSWRVEFPRDDTSITYGLSTIVDDPTALDPFPAAELLRKPRKADGTEWDLSYKGYEGGAKPDHPGGRWTLHSEIEGNGMETLCTIAKVLAILGPLTAALGVVAGAIGGAVYGAVKGYQLAHDGCDDVCGIPILCDVVCFIAGVVAAVVGAIVGANVGAIAGAIPGLGAVILGGLLSTVIRHNGQFTDVANDSDSGNIEEEDCVFIKGDQVYDAGHEEGWVEIHPVRQLQKICSHQAFLQPGEQYDPACCPSAPTGSTRFTSPQFISDVNAFWERWCGAYEDADDPGTKGAQEDPPNLWCVHPLIDGCRDRNGEPAPIG
jgi:hypothetical protein